MDLSSSEDEFDMILNKNFLNEIEDVVKMEPDNKDEENTSSSISNVTTSSETVKKSVDQNPVETFKKSVDQNPVETFNRVSGASYRGSGGDGSEYLPAGSGVGGVFAYVRRSAEDRTNKPLDVQIKTINDYVEENPRNFGSFKKQSIRAYYGDNGVSGSTEVNLRPGLKKMFDDLDDLLKQQDAPIIHVVIYDATRLARTAAVGSSIKEQLSKKGITLHLAQTRMVVEGSTEGMIFGIGLHMAESERNATIVRVKQAFKYKDDWDPRKSYGWKYMGKGVKPEPIPEEQELLSKIKEMYESGSPIKEITAFMKASGKRRCRKLGEEDKYVEWNGTDVSFIIQKNKFVWPGTKFSDLRVMVHEFVESLSSDDNSNIMDRFIKENRSLIVEGTKLNKPMLSKILTNEKKGNDSRVHRLIKTWVKQGRSNDDIVNILNEQIPKEDNSKWPRQTVWRRIKEVEAEIEFERKRSL